MGADWKNELANIRENLPPGKGDVIESAPQPQAQDQARETPTPEAEQKETQPDIEIPRQSPLYIYYAANYELDPLIAKLYPQGKRQYLNAMLRSMEAGQNLWPESITNRKEALEPVSEKDIRGWFESSGSRALAQLGYSNPKQYLQEILQQDLKPASAEAERGTQEARNIAKPPAGESPARPAEVRRVTSRFREAREIMDSPEFQQKAANFLKAIKAEYGGWEEFLQYAGNVLDVAHRKEVSLNSAPTYIILGREILGDPQRAEQFKEYEKLSRLSLEEIQKEIQRQNLTGLPEGVKTNKPGILRGMLLKYLKELPLPSDTWVSARKVVNGRPEGVRQVSTEALSPQPVSSEQYHSGDNHSDVMAKILTRAQKRAIGRLYDPEEEAGII